MKKSILVVVIGLILLITIGTNFMEIRAYSRETVYYTYKGRNNSCYGYIFQE